MINHVVVLKFKSGITESDIEELEKMLDDLPNKITEIQSTPIDQPGISSRYKKIKRNRSGFRVQRFKG
jgi:hypothetical protein